MLVFGIDVPLLEIVLVFTIITFILLIEALIIIALMSRQMNKMQKLGDLTEKLSETLLEIKRKEIEELNLIRGK